VAALLSRFSRKVRLPGFGVSETTPREQSDVSTSKDADQSEFKKNRDNQNDSRANEERNVAS
jgi:hypothetical protein